MQSIANIPGDRFHYARRRQPERPRSLASGLGYGRAAIQGTLALEEELEPPSLVEHQFRERGSMIAAYG
jgi:hypothetical protein